MTNMARLLSCGTIWDLLSSTSGNQLERLQSSLACPLSFGSCECHSGRVPESRCLNKGNRSGFKPDTEARCLGYFVVSIPHIRSGILPDIRGRMPRLFCIFNSPNRSGILPDTEARCLGYFLFSIPPMGQASCLTPRQDASAILYFQFPQ